MPIDNVSWCSSIGIYNKLIYQTQQSSKVKEPLLFLKVLLLFINYIFATGRFLANFLKVIDVEILFLLYIKFLLYLCSDIEINPGSSLDFLSLVNELHSSHNFIYFRYS